MHNFLNFVKELRVGFTLLCCSPCLTPLSQMVEIWLGGLFTPEAYITATRQYVAQSNNWSLEELYLDVRITPPPPPPLSLYLSSCDSLENLIYTKGQMHEHIMRVMCITVVKIIGEQCFVLKLHANVYILQVRVDVKGKLSDCSFGVTGERLVCHE